MANGKNVWLKRIEDRENKCHVVTKFKGKFQEAAKTNRMGRIYPRAGSLFEDHQPPKLYDQHVNKDPNQKKTVEERFQSIGEDECGFFPIRPKTENVSVEERWTPPNQDEDIWIPLRPPAKKEEVIELDLDLSQVKVSNDRYKAYERLKLAEDAMFIYGKSQEELQQMKQQKLEELKLQVAAANPSYLGVPATTLAGDGLYVSGGTVTISSADVTPSQISAAGSISYAFDGTVSMGTFTISSSAAVSPGNITISGICP